MREKSKLGIFLIIQILLFLCQSTALIPVAAITASFTEDFTTTTYRDSVNTDTVGWGSGVISSPSRAPVQIGSYNTPGLAYGVFVDGDHAFIADGTSGLRVVNIEDLANPVSLGVYNTPGTARGVFVTGDYAFIADYDCGLQVIDIADPTAPSLLGSCDTSGNAHAVYVTGDYAFVADGTRGLQVIDISNPINPSLVGSCDTATAYDVFITANNAFIADSSYGLKIIDISDPTNPVLDSSCDTPDNALKVSIAGDYAYIADDEGGLQVIDISDPSTPVSAGSYDTPANARSVCISGDYAYVANVDPGSADNLQIIDISNPSKPVNAGSYSGLYYGYDITVKGNHVFIADAYAGLRIGKISDPVAPSLVGGYDTPAESYDVFVDGNYAYMADQTSGLQIVNISDPTDPIYTGSYNTPDYARGVFVDGDHAFVTDGESGLQIIDISDPSNPTYTGHYDYSAFNLAIEVYVDGNYAYLADLESRLLQIINISDPSAPTLISSHPTLGEPRGVFIAGDYAYVAVYYKGLQVINISDPSNPTDVDFYDTPGYSHTVVVAGDYAYVADEDGGLQVIDVSDPTNLSLAGYYDTPHRAYDVFIDGNQAYISDGSTGLLVLDISDPSEPLLTGTINTGGSAYSAYVAGDYAYLADYDGGLLIFEVNVNRHRQYLTPSTTQSTTVFSSPTSSVFHSATLVSTANIPTDTSITYYLSSNGGADWETVTPGAEYIFTNIGSELKWKTVFVNTAPLITAELFSLTIQYKYTFNAPVLSSPLQSTLTTDNTPTFEWEAATGSVSYRFQLDTAITFDSINLVDVEHTSLNYTHSSALPDGIWYWRVASKDSAGDLGSYSDHLKLIIDTQAPIINHPEDIEYVEGANGQIIWIPSDDNPFYYSIKREGIEIDSGPWAGGSIVISESLPYGTYTYSCTVYDMADFSISDFVSVTVLDITAPTIDSPDDLIYEQGSIGNHITWNLDENNPYLYNLTIDGFEEDSYAWLGGTITVDIDGLSKGSHTYVCTVIDKEGFSVSDTVIVTVVDTSDPLIDSPTDLIFEYATTGYNITWNPEDMNPATFNVTRNDVKIEGGPWNGEIIIVNIEDLSIGTYIYVCTVSDSDGHNSSDTVIVTITEIMAPTIDHPEDVTYEEGNVGNTITWNPTDNNPGNYIVYRNNVQIASDTWISGTAIVVNIETLSTGSYNYTIVVSDLSGNFVVDTVTITVTDEAITTTVTTTTTTEAKETHGFELQTIITSIFIMVGAFTMRRKYRQ